MRINCIILCLLCLLWNTGQAARSFAHRPDVNEFITEVAQQDGFKKSALVTLLDQVKPQAKILTLIARPYEAQPWYKYRQHFINPKRIQQGVIFWQQHEAILQKAEHEFGVPAEIIVAILGVETYYGKHMSAYRTLDALATLAFDYPPRQKFFRKELHQFIRLVEQKKLEPYKTYGSYAGAVGLPQFMPSSILQYGLDYDHDGVIGIFNHPTDAIGSIANYLKKHGWQRHQPIAIPAKHKGNVYQVAINNQNKRHRSKQFRPKYRAAFLQKKYHVTPKHPLAPSTRATVFTLTMPTHPQLWLGLQNFYVLTRYNVSKNYAMSVRGLAKAIKKEHDRRVVKREKVHQTVSI